MSERRSIMCQGRIVWVSGDLFKGQIKKDHQTKQPMMDKLNQPITEYGFGLAVPRESLTQDETNIWGAIHAEAMTLFPGGHIPPDFAMKFKDGDTAVDPTGKPYNLRAGYAGHVVFACTTRIPIKYFKNENNQNIQINEGIKCGDYVNVQLGMQAHPAVGQGKAGIYLNPNAVQFLGFGEAIINAPTGDQIFGTDTPALPSGASAVPVAQPGMIVPSTAAPQVAPAPMAPPAPHYGVLPPPAQQPQAMPVAPAPVVAPGPALTPLAPGQPMTPENMPPQATAAALYAAPSMASPAMPGPPVNTAQTAAPGMPGYPPAMPGQVPAPMPVAVTPIGVMPGMPAPLPQ